MGQSFYSFGHGTLDVIMLENFVLHRNSLRHQTSINQKWSDLDCKEDVTAVPYQIDSLFSLFLHQYEVLCSGVNILWAQRQQTLEKTNSSCTILCALPTEISGRSEIPAIVTFLSIKMRTLSEPTISDVVAIQNKITMKYEKKFQRKVFDEFEDRSKCK